MTILPRDPPPSSGSRKAVVPGGKHGIPRGNSCTRGYMWILGGWHERIWFSSVVYRDCMWGIGGWSGNPSKNWDDIWYSTDGKNWTELKTEGLKWKERHGHSAFVFQDKIWIAGGMTPPLVNDV
ncbi:MAG: hypothetical protein ACOX19_10865 [Fermentimonas sp.]